MSDLLKISEALDSKDIGDIAVALNGLPDEMDVVGCEPSFVAILHELMTWNLTENPETSDFVLRHLMSLLTTQKTIRGLCERILKTQCPVGVQIAVETMMTQSWKLSLEDCEDVGKRMMEVQKSQQLNDENSEEYASRLAANCTILRVSGTRKRILADLLETGLYRMNPPKNGFPIGLLHEIAIIFPFHPLLDAEDQKNTENVFVIPRVIPNFERFHLEIDEFCRFVTSDSPLSNGSSRELLGVFWRMGSRMEQLPEFGASEIEPAVSLWMAVFGILETDQITASDIPETGKLIEKMTKKFELSRRPLFLKFLLKNLGDLDDSSFSWEPQFAAVIIDTFKRDACAGNYSEYFEELGDFWTQVRRMKYDDVYYASAYFAAVFALAEGQAFFRIKKELMRVVYEQILKPIHGQIVDFVRMKEMEKKEAIEKGRNEMLMQHQNLGSEVFLLITSNFQNAEETILAFLNE